MYKYKNKNGQLSISHTIFLILSHTSIEILCFSFNEIIISFFVKNYKNGYASNQKINKYTRL